MATFPELTIRFPFSLMQDVHALSEREGQTLDSFVIQSVAEKVSALRARGLADPLTPLEQHAYMEARAARSKPGTLDQLLRKAGTAEPITGDEFPDGWVDGTA